MKLTVLQENLAKAVTTASRFASSRVQLPILGNILLSASKTKLNIASTNLEISVSIVVGAKIEDPGEISIPAKTLSDIISNLPRDTVSIVSENEQLKITSSGFSSKVLGMNASDFPKVPTSLSIDGSINLPRKELVSALSQVVFATSLDETRPILTGVLFILDKNTLTLVATDGFRLSKKEISLKAQRGQKARRMVIPKGVLNEIGRVSEELEEVKMDVQEKEKQVVFGMEDITLTSRLLEGDYPDFAKILPKTSELTVLVDKEEFARAVKLASVFARDSANIVKIKILESAIKVLAESGTSGTQETKVDARVTTKADLAEWEISFNFKFLEEFLHSVSGDEVMMEFTTPDKAGVFTDSSDSKYLHLIMPVKVQS